MSKFTLSAALACALLASACAPAKAKLASISALLPDLGQTADLPATRWDHRPEAAAWTRSTMDVVAAHDDVLAGAVPADIEGWCAGYENASLPERRAFWVGLLSAVAKYESSWNPKASGGGGRYIGVMQISPKSAANYGCEATSVAGLKDGAANLACATKMMAAQVGRDGVVAGKGNRGIGRDWMPLRKAAYRSEMRDWLQGQSYCN